MRQDCTSNSANIVVLGPISVKHVTRADWAGARTPPPLVTPTPNFRPVRKVGSVAEKSISSVLFFGLNCIFVFSRKSHSVRPKLLFFRRKVFFWAYRVSEKQIFQKKNYLEKNTRTTQQPPLLPEEVKHMAPADVLGTCGTGKAMDAGVKSGFYPHRLQMAERKT